MERELNDELVNTCMYLATSLIFVNICLCSILLQQNVCQLGEEMHSFDNTNEQVHW